MNPRELPVVSSVSDSGADDRVFDWLLLAGPLVIGAIVVLDRSLLTRVLATVYVAVLVTYVLYRGVT